MRLACYRAFHLDSENGRVVAKLKGDARQQKDEDWLVRRAYADRRNPGRRRWRWGAVSRGRDVIWEDFGSAG